MTRRPALCLNLYLHQRPVLIVGTGAGADERASRFEAAGAVLTRLSESEWRAGRSGTFFAVVAHSEDAELNAEVADWARARGWLGYAHDQPDRSDFSFPALSRRGPIQLAISTQGVAPALAAQLRRQVDALLERSGEALDAVVRELEDVRANLPPGATRMHTLKAIAARVRLVGSFDTRS